MMKSAFLVLGSTFVVLSATAQAHPFPERCEQCGYRPVSRYSSSNDRWQQTGGRYAADAWLDRYDRDCADGRCGIDTGGCVGGQCRPRDGHCSDGRCCVDGRCDGRCDCPTGDCRDGSCAPSGGYGDAYRRPFPWVSDDSRRLADPFRPADLRDDWRGRPDPRPLPVNYRPRRYQSGRPTYQNIQWHSSIRRAVEQASRENRQILVQVTAPWCPHCDRMKQQTWTDPGLVHAINSQFVAVEVNADQQRDFVQQMGIQSLPTTLIVSPNLSIQDRLEGFQSADQLLRTMNR